MRTPMPEPEAPPQAPPPPSGPPAPDQPLEGDARERRDEAFRVRARELEQENDQLRGNLDVYLRREAEAMVAGRLLSSGDLWLQSELKDVLGEEGRPDPAKVTEAVQALLEVRPHLAPTKPS